MPNSHVKERLSEYCLGELEQGEARLVAEHILACKDCRENYEEIKRGVAFVAELKPVQAPLYLWPEIAARLDSASISGTPGKSVWTIALASAAALILLTIGTLWYRSRTPDPTEITRVDPTPMTTPSTIGPTPAPEASTLPSPTPVKQPSPTVELARGSMEVTSLAGAPLLASNILKGKGNLATGELLQTDSQSRAQIKVADIGKVDVEPNSIIGLVLTGPNEHRLDLKRGRVHALIKAPPRIFVVETPAATAVDLGCEYTLEVDESGGSTLRVTGGYVSLERSGRQAFVPAGALCFTRPRIGPGTPFFEDATNVFRKAVEDFDLGRDRAGAIQTMLNEARRRDTLTLWNLLTQVNGAERERLFDKLNELFPAPDEVTRAGVLKLNRAMLEAYRKRLEWAW